MLPRALLFIGLSIGLFLCASASLEEALAQSTCLSEAGKFKALILQDVSVPLRPFDEPPVKAAEAAHQQFGSQLSWILSGLKGVPGVIEVAIATFTDRAYVGRRSHAKGDHCFRLAQDFIGVSKIANESLIQDLAPVVSTETLGGHLDALYTASRLKGWKRDHHTTTSERSELQKTTTTSASSEIGSNETKPIRFVLLFTANGYRPHGHIDEVLNLDETRDFPAGCALNDYPSVALLKLAIDKFDIEPIIITRKSLSSNYDDLLGYLQRGGVVSSQVDRRTSSGALPEELYELLAEDIIGAMEDICNTRLMAPRVIDWAGATGDRSGVKDLAVRGSTSLAGAAAQCVEKCKIADRTKYAFSYEECVKRCGEGGGGGGGDVAVKGVSARLRGGKKVPMQVSKNRRSPTKITITV